MIVVDTNVIAYLLVQGERTDLAQDVFSRDDEWIAPPLWRSELRNVLSGYVRRKEFGIDGALEAMTVAQNVMGEVDYLPSSERVLELAVESGCTAYDCEFVAVAEELGVPLITSDRRILDGFPRIASSMETFARS